MKYIDDDNFNYDDNDDFDDFDTRDEDFDYEIREISEYIYNPKNDFDDYGF